MVAPLIGRAALMAARVLAKQGAKKVVKSTAKKVAKKTVSKKNPQQAVERMLRAENKGDAHMAGKIKKLRAQEDSGLISGGERARALNSMTKSHRKLVRGRRKP